MDSIELSAPAKVNLFLKVLNKRKDSYHNIVTLFERISLCDQIKISKIMKGIVVTCDRYITHKPQDNIAYRAADLILRTAKIDMGVKIHIKKRIPVAAGLGGGSSDAAGVLIGIDRLFKLNISKDRLMRLGAKLGADVPFFIFDAPFAIGRGIGDKLEKVDLNTKFYNMIIYPGFKVATNEIYQALDVKGFVSQHGLGPNTRLFLRCLTNKWGDVKISPLKNLDSLEDILYNDLEKVVVSKRPKIGKVIKCLASSLDKRIMVSGSGPSVFCLCSTRREAMQAKERLYSSIPKSLRRRWQIFVVETMV